MKSALHTDNIHLYIMKKTLLTVLAVAGLMTATSCQKEPLSATRSGEVEFSITAGIPGGIMTYAPASSGSHNGGKLLLDPSEYSLRYTLEVYDKDGSLAYDETRYAADGTFDGITFDVRLLAKTYDFVFWADFVKKDGKAFYNVEDLRNITYAGAVDAQTLATDAADAYYSNEEVDLTQGSLSLDVMLKRPFGKVRLIATDQLDDNHNHQTEVPETVTVDFRDAEIPTAFNAIEGKAVEGNTAKAGVLTFTAEKEDTEVGGTQYSGVYLLGMDYIFESPEIPSYSMDVEVKSNLGNVIGQRALSSTGTGEQADNGDRQLLHQ